MRACACVRARVYLARSLGIPPSHESSLPPSLVRLLACLPAPHIAQVAAVKLCSQLLIDTHITPSTSGNLEMGSFATTLQHMGAAVGCHGLELAILEGTYGSLWH